MMLRITNRVQAGHHDDPAAIDTVVETVRKARQQEAARSAEDDRMCGRGIEDRVHHRIYCINELVAEARSLEFVPVARLRHVSDRGCKEPGLCTTISREAAAWRLPRR